jgi:hypothetical protein
MARIATVTEETVALAHTGRGVQLQPGRYPVVEIDGAAERRVAYLEGPDGGALVCVSLVDPHVTIGKEGQ